MANFEPMLPLIATALGKGKTQRGFTPDFLAPMVAPVYEDILEYCLAEHYWAFAEALPVVPEESTKKPPLDYRKLYILPDDFVAATYVNGSGEQLVGWRYGWDIYGKYMASNFPVYLSYTRKEFDYNNFSAPFKQFLAITVAARICLLATGDTDLKDSLMRERKEIRPDVINIDMRDQGELEQVTISNVAGSRMRGGSGYTVARDVGTGTLNVGAFAEGPLNRE